MKIDYNKIKKNICLKETVELRFCPDEETIRDPYFKAKVEHHLKTCPLCMDRNPDPFYDIALKLKTEENLPKVLENHIGVLKSELGKWKNNFYLNPPLVYVQKEKNDFFECFLVSPVTELFSEKDLYIPDSISEFIPYMIEGWNKLKIHKSLFSHSICDLSEFKKDIDLFLDFGKIPFWSKKTFKNKNMEEVKIFRNLEKFSASNFSSSPAFLLANAIKNKAQNLISNGFEFNENLFKQPELLIREIAASLNKVPVHGASENINLYFYSVIVENNEIKDVIQVEDAKAEEDFIDNDSRIISGIAKAPENQLLYSGSNALLQTNSGKTFESIQADFDDETNIFQAKFTFSKGKNIWFFNWYKI
jgi:hypothetical protein